jgi:uncharacterized protein YjiS (DUF1127 family)
MNAKIHALAHAPRKAIPFAQAFNALARKLIRDRALLKLQNFDDHLLGDIGLTRDDVETMRRQR